MSNIPKWVYKYPKKDRHGNKIGGHVWRARYRDRAGQEHTKHFPKKSDAERWLEEITADIVTGNYVDPKAGRQTLKSYAEEWRKRRVSIRESSARDYETQLRRHVYPHLGSTSLIDLERTQIQDWVALLNQSLAPTTVRKVHGILSSVLNDAVLNKKLASNPCVKPDLPEVVSTRVEIPTPEVVRAIYDNMTAEYQAMVHLAAASGVRQGEAFGLTRDRVNFLRKTIVIDRQAVISKGGPKFGPPKREKSNREIPVPDDLIVELAQHVDKYNVAPTGLLFTAQDGLFVRKATFNTGPWKDACKAAHAPGFTFHGLRHYYASLLIRYGESVKTVQARLGHATAAETLDTYAHLWPDSDDRTRKAAATALMVSENIGEDAGNTIPL